MLQSEAERIERGDLDYESDDPDPEDFRWSGVTCGSCDEPSDRVYECARCGCIVCPCCVCSSTGGGYSCPDCDGAFVMVECKKKEG
jgi:hypothetical protein